MELDFLKWVEHSGFLILAGNKKVYIDPYHVRNPVRADVIFITHSHFDHLSPDDIRKIEGPNTQFVAPKEAASKLAGKKLLSVEPGKNYSVAGLNFKTVPAYNIKPERLSFHPKAKGWVGYIIDVNGTKIYHAGDTDLTEEMKRVETDIALIPMGGTFTMDLDEAIEAANSIKAGKVAPMHYKVHFGRDGYKRAEEEFKSRVKNGIILDQIQEPYFSE